MGAGFRYPLSLQLTLPDDYLANQPFSELLEALQRLGFWGVEINVSDPRAHDFASIQGYLKERGLELSMLATGRTAQRRGLSLSSPDGGTRRRSVAVCRELIDWIGDQATGMILGFMKGGTSLDRQEAQRRFAESLAEIIPEAERRGVPVLVEATNRYESAVANTIEEAGSLVEKWGAAVAQILPDTFHMNIEEADSLDALRRGRHRFTSLHLSDNNRCYPGFGAIDFGRYFALLEEIGYTGRLAIEGNPVNDIASDARASVARLAPLLLGA